jgi:hypothetical protein
MFLAILICTFFKTFVLHAQNGLKRGEIVNHEICITQPKQSYSYYLPSDYSSSRKYPVIFCFDPGARGQLPINLYGPIAEKYKYILIGSNNSKNGNLTDNYRIATVLFDNVFTKLSIDYSRVYLLGMSGGSRLASGIAYNSDGISGVIGCAAGLLESIQNYSKIRFSYVGIVGLRDMNFTEMLSLDEKMDLFPIKHQFIYYEGLHDWPPLSTMEESIQWMDVFAMKNNVLKTDTIFIQQLASRYESELKDSMIMDLHCRYDLYRSLQNCWSGFKNTSSIQDSIKVIGDDMRYLEQKAKFRKIIDHEIQLIKNFISELDKFVYSKESSQSIDWWKSKIASIRELTKLNNQDQQNSGYRIQQTILFWASDEFLKNIDREDPIPAINALLICSLVQPSEYWPDYYLATLYARSSQKMKAMASLESAISKGFSDLERIEAEPAFALWAKNKRFQDLINTIKMNQKETN